MDPLTGFVTIVSLLGTFKSERYNRENADYQEFVNWLSNQRHGDIVDLLGENNEAIRAITSLLNESHDSIIEKLREIEKMVSGLMTARNDAFSALAEAIHPEAGLSNQAISILRQMHNIGENKLTCLKFQGQTALLCSTKDGSIEINEQAHLREDLNQLVVRKLLNQQNNSYTITRRGIEIAQNAPQP